MKQYQRKGFTLVELLAVIVVLGIILSIAVPNVLNIIANSRKDSYLSTAKMAISTAKLQVGSDDNLQPAAGACYAIKFNTLPLENLGDVDPEASFVTVRNTAGDYTYQVALKVSETFMIKLISDSDLSGPNARTKVETYSAGTYSTVPVDCDVKPTP